MSQVFSNLPMRQRRLIVVVAGSGCAGISLTEVLVAAVLMAMVLVATIPAHNTIMGAINSSGAQARLNAVIDNDLARIKQIAQAFNACSSAANGALGSIDTTGCGTYGEANSYYYFPDPTRASGSGTDVASFEAACGSTSSSSHITKKFIELVAATSSPDLSREGIAKTVTRQDGANSYNNNVVVVYSGSRGVKRTAVISPFLSYWCP